MDVFVGIDVGGTKTHTLAVNANGEVLGFVLDGPSGTHRVGFDQFKKVIIRSLEFAFKRGGFSMSDVTAIGLGVAGLDWPIDRTRIEAALSTLNLSGQIALHNDGDLPLAAGCKEGWGIAVIAGTGSVVTGIGPTGAYARSTGGSSLLGELGGAKELVDLAIQAVSHAYIQRGPQTEISQEMVAAYDQEDVVSMLGAIARKDLEISPNFSRKISKLAQAGDVVAKRILKESAEDLGYTTLAVIQQLSLQSQPFEIVLSGSMFNIGSLMVNPLKSVILADAPGAEFTKIKTEPVVGGVILAMKKAGFDFQAIREKMIREVNELSALNPNPTIPDIAQGDPPVSLKERR